MTSKDYATRNCHQVPTRQHGGPQQVTNCTKVKCSNLTLTGKRAALLWTCVLWTSLLLPTVPRQCEISRRFELQQDVANLSGCALTRNPFLGRTRSCWSLFIPENHVLRWANSGFRSVSLLMRDILPRVGDLNRTLF